MTLTAGTKLGPYEILSPLGAGGMGEVYRARDTRLGREVAVKVLPAEFAADPGRLRRFEQEARAASALNHPNILTIHDVGTCDGVTYVVTEFLEGETLRGALLPGGLPPKRALDYALQIAHGLSAAHERGIIHRDLKPENLFVTRDGRVKILDFGLAKLESPGTGSRAQSELPTESRGTEPGVVLGTLGYMSPEQLRGQPADARSDIFSFGAILYEMLSGKRAFHGDSAADTMSAILKEEPSELSGARRGIPPGLERVVRHCLEKEPDRRFRSAHDLAFDLEALSDGLSVPSSVRPSRRWIAVAATFGVLVAAATVVIRFWPRGGAINSVAVLPFVNASGDPAIEYLSDGISESLINSLSQLPNLRVISRASSFHYKGKEPEPSVVARGLRVRGVVTGRVAQRGEMLSIATELIDARDNRQLWGDRYNRKLADLLAVQEEIAKEISEKLRLRLTGEEKKRLAKRYTESIEAYQLYLKGRHSWEKRTQDGLKESIDYFHQAIDKDPGYALAYAGLADSYAILSSYDVLSPRESIPKARAAASKALEIDDSLAQPHATLAYALYSYDWNWTAAEGEFQKAIALDPNYPTAHHWYGLLLAYLGRFDEALAQLRRARELDPFSAIIQANVGRVHYFARQYDLAIEEGRKADLGWTHATVAEAYAAKGMLEQALSEYQKAVDLSGRTPGRLGYLARSQALAGRQCEARRTMEEMKSLSTRQYVSPGFIAIIYAGLGEKDRAFEWLEKAYSDHSWDLVYLGVDPRFDALRTDPRFAGLLRRLNLAPPS